MAARQYYSVESLGESTATNTYTAKCVLTFTPDANADYFIIASAQGSHDTTTGSVRVIIELEDPGNNTLWGCELKPQEYTTPKDWMSFFALGKYSAGASPTAITHRILFLSSTATTARIKNARLIAIKASADDKFASNVNEASVATSAWSTHTTLTFTPASQGDYLVIGAAAIACDTAGGRVGARLNHATAGTTYGGRDCYVKSDYERRVFAVSPKINLNAVSNTFTLQYHSPDNSTGVTCAYSAILALRLDGFEAAYTNQDFSASPINTPLTGYQDALTVSATPAAVAHLIVGTSHQRIASNTISQYQQLIADNPSTTFSEYTQEGVNANSYYGLGLAAITTPAASAANWKWQYKCEASSTAYAADLAIAVLQLEAGSTTFTGTAAPTIAALTGAASGAETFGGTAAVTLSAFVSTASASSAEPVTGTATPTIAAFTSDATATETFVGTAAGTIAAFAASASAAEAVTGSSAGTVGAFTSSMTASETFSGTATPTVPAFTLAASGAESFVGTAADTVAAFTASAAAAETLAGASAPTVAAFASSTTAAEILIGTAGTTVGALTSAVSAAERFTGSAADTLSAFTPATTATESYTGTALPVVGAFTSAATATEIYIGAAVATLAPFVADASEAGPTLITGEAGDTLDPLASSAFGIEIFIGSFGQTIAGFFANGGGLAGTFHPIVQLAGTYTPIFAGRGIRRATTVLDGRRVHTSALVGVKTDVTSLGGTKTDVTSLGGTIPRKP